jgi:hypothetical protein
VSRIQPKSIFTLVPHLGKAVRAVPNEERDAYLKALLRDARAGNIDALAKRLEQPSAPPPEPFAQTQEEPMQQEVPSSYPLDLVIYDGAAVVHRA